MDYLIGKVIDNRYEIVEKVGSGGMATVYKAKCQVLDRFVGIKVLKDSLKYDTEVVKKFNTESRAAARLSHPNIVQVYDVSEKGNIDYIVMEFVDGITLKEYIQQKGHLSPEEACEFAVQIGRALVCAHANGIIHRDIKPHNVLITADGVAKVADFGIAQAATSETLVAGGGAMGSVHYISPEQARGGYTNERSDIYSLGVVMYEMLTGEVPFDGANPVSIALAKLENDPEDLRNKVAHYIPDAIARVCMKAISKEQHSRYQSASEMVADLEGIIGISTPVRDEDEKKYETKRLKKEQTRNEYNMRKKTNKKKKNNGAKVAILTVLLAAVLGILSYFFMVGGAKEYQVPDLTNMTVEEAQEALTRENLRLNESIDYEHSEEIDEGKIIRQNPGINQSVKKNRKIKVTVSLGAENDEISIPDVVSLTTEEAKKRLEEKGFKCNVQEEFSETIEFGYVIRQTPDKNSKAKKGTEVTIYVSGEEEQAVVPKITGCTQEEAIKLLEEAGLMIGDVTMGESDEEKGIVIGQTPSAKTGVEKGTKVDIMISQGQYIPPVQTYVPPRTHIPTQPPVHQQTGNSGTTNEEFKKKTLTVAIPKEGGETVHIRAVAGGNVVYNRAHKRSEGTVDVTVQGKSKSSMNVQIYIDGTLAADKVVNFD